MNTNELILVVDDEALNRELLTEVLQRNGYRVATAANGRQALDYLLTHERPSLIVLDLNMPVLNGWGFRKKQLQEPELATIPVLLCSSEEDLARHAEALRVAGYFPKQQGFWELLQVLGRLVSSPSARIAAGCCPC